MKQWEVERVSAPNHTWEPKIPRGWEPFGIQQTEFGCYVWLKKIHVPKKRAKVKDSQQGGEVDD